jgi:hypothetical protein
MFYKLESRGTGLAMLASLFNFLIQNHIKYTYDFKLGGIELTDDDYNYIESNFKPDLEQSSINYREEPKKPAKAEIKRNKRRKLF